MKKIIGILILTLLLVSNAFAETATVNLAWDVYNPDTDGQAPVGYYLFRYLTDRNVNIKQEAGGPPNNTHSFTADFVVGQQYYFVAQAWAYGGDGSPNPSGDSTPPLPFIYRGAGNHYSSPLPTGVVIPPPTVFNAIDINTATWVKGSGTPVPVGYMLHYYPTSQGISAQQTKFVSGNVSTTTLADLNLTLNVQYTMYVAAVVYGIDGISYVESTSSNTDTFTKVTGASTTAPSAPKSLKITK